MIRAILSVGCLISATILFAAMFIVPAILSIPPACAKGADAVEAYLENLPLGEPLMRGVVLLGIAAIVLGWKALAERRLEEY
ncbi:hypothetical protein [Lacipirellula parvula]|uniref:Uncharacterized protein n=1 Tax=Lacipirellula parvula TaxID=2650471 RepID=A0A5K7XGL5_9BACT|nr:hypothetical protein [Lacipirellula parvula]BBO32109.1 hypothetical protein PLANPX_1721 [Lacipirellula parvula]